MDKARIEVAGLVTAITALMAALNPTSQISVYAFLFTLANFSGLTFSLSNFDEIPKKTVLAQVTMLSAGFTTVLATYFAGTVPPAQPQNLALYIILFTLVVLQILPSELIDRIR